jgi:hypothetical protein
LAANVAASGFDVSTPDVDETLVFAAAAAALASWWL